MSVHKRARKIQADNKQKAKSCLNTVTQFRYKKYISYLDLHAPNRFTQFEHDKDQVRVHGLPAAGAGLLSAQNKY